MILSHPLTDTTQKEDIIIAYVTVLTYETTFELTVVLITVTRINSGLLDTHMYIYNDFLLVIID